MIYFFGKPTGSLYAVQTTKNIDPSIQEKLVWLFGNQKLVDKKFLEGNFIGPRATMITPWSTNAVEITQNMDIEGISRIEMFIAKNPEEEFDPMLYEVYNGLDQSIFDIDVIPEPMTNIINIEAYNQKEGVGFKQTRNYLFGRIVQKFRATPNRFGGLWFFSGQFRNIAGIKFSMDVL